MLWFRVAAVLVKEWSGKELLKEMAVVMYEKQLATFINYLLLYKKITLKLSSLEQHIVIISHSF